MNWLIFKAFIKVVIRLDCSFIFIDESSFSSWALKTRTWEKKGKQAIVVRPYEMKSVAMMGALLSDGTLVSVLRQGTNSRNETVDFLLKLELFLKEKHGKNYRSFWNRLIVVMDNASIHKTKEVKNFFTKRAIQCVTLPQYTPECNPIERVFALLKRSVSSCNLSNW